MIPGQPQVPDQALAREHELSTALQQLVEERTREVQRLRTEIKQLQQRETDLRAALDRALVAGNAGTAASAHSGISAGNATTGPPAADGGEVPSPAAAAAAAAEQARRDLEQQHAAMIKHLQSALAKEQHRRKEAETELSRLKQETSAPPYGGGQPSDAELTAAKQEVAELRTALHQERAARERLARKFRALQQRADAGGAATQNTSTENADLRLRLKQLDEEKQNITQSFNRSLAESQQHAAELERQLAEAQTTGNAAATPDDDLSNIRAENSALRARLDDEHRRTEALAAKLKVATRVTDLIFKMQAQSTSR